MLRIVVSTTAALALTTGLLAPASAQASVKAFGNGENGLFELATFKTAKCRKGKGKSEESLKFTATAKSSNGYRLSVDLFTRGLEHNLAYGGPNQFTVEGPAGVWSNLNVPPNAPPGGGGIEFNRKKTRMGLAFSPAFPSAGGSVTASVTGGLKCKYPKKKKRRARRSTATGAAARAKTKITDTSVNPNDDGGNRISGVVVSGREKCHNNRKVVLVKKTGRKRNVRRDEKIGSDRATPNGDGSQYRIDFEGSGKYYTYVKKTKSCGGAYSGVVSVSEES